MILRPQDLLLVLKLAARPPAEGEVVHLPTLAQATGLSVTETHQALKRAEAAQLLTRRDVLSKTPTRGRPLRIGSVHWAALGEFVRYGVPYVYVAERGRIARGLLTGSNAPPVQQELGLQEAGIPLVWPDARGDTRGESFAPLYPSAVTAARQDSRLYKLLVLVDVIRGGTARERELGRELLSRTLIQWREGRMQSGNTYSG